MIGKHFHARIYCGSKKAMMLLEFFLLAKGKASFFLLLVSHLFYLSGVKQSSKVKVVVPLVSIMEDLVCYTWTC